MITVENRADRVNQEHVTRPNKKCVSAGEGLKTENVELKRKNAEMAAELHKIETKYKRIAELLDKVTIIKDKSQPILSKLEEIGVYPGEEYRSAQKGMRSTEKRDEAHSKLTIDSVDSQATFVDESEIANKDIFSNGIMQLFKGHRNDPPRPKKCVTANEGQYQLELSNLKQELEEKDKTINEYKGFIVQLMRTLQLMATDAENQQRFANAKNLLP